MKTKKRGFTLVELMIVVSIISLLAMIGLVSYTGMSKRSRDARRMSDLKIIQSALEQYHSDWGYYPNTDTLGLSISKGGRTYHSNVPTDPQNSANYNYTRLPASCDNESPTTMCTNYCLSALLEDSNLGSTECTGAVGDNYAIKAP